MKTILHYSIGFSSDGGGGLTKYSTDLIMKQSENNKVVLLSMGNIRLFSRRKLIKRNAIRNGIENYSIINPLPNTFMCGLRSERYLKEKTEKEIWKNFFLKIKPDIFHIHTLIGLNEECINVAKELNIPMVYTSHDYFGLCPKQTLLFKNSNCNKFDSCDNCAECNKTALSDFKSYLLHTKLFPKLRKWNFTKLLKNKFKEKISDDRYEADLIPLDFISLKYKYEKIFNQIDYFHFNSSVSKEIFEMVLKKTIDNGKVILISHNGITDNRKEKRYNSKKLRLLYLGPPQVFKGFPFLISVLDNLYLTNHSFELNVYCNTDIQRDYLNVVQIGYKYNELEKIFDNTDLLLVPSQWYETFGFVVREAMSFGVPVMVTETVGAKDIIEHEKNGFIVKSENWYQMLENITNNPGILKKMNEHILNEKFYSMDDHNKEVIDLYELLLKVGE